MKQILPGYKLIESICNAHGIPPQNVRRLILDVSFNGVPILYVERLGDSRLLEINWGMSSDIQVVDVESANDEGGCPECQSKIVVDMTAGGDTNRQYTCAECGANWEGEPL